MDIRKALMTRSEAGKNIPRSDNQMLCISFPVLTFLFGVLIFSMKMTIYHLNHISTDSSLNISIFKEWILPMYLVKLDYLILLGKVRCSWKRLHHTQSFTSGSHWDHIILLMASSWPLRGRVIWVSHRNLRLCARISTAKQSSSKIFLLPPEIKSSESD